MSDCANGITWTSVLGLPIAITILLVGWVLADAIVKIANAKAYAIRALDDRKKENDNEHS